MKPVLANDAKATEHILHRQAIGNRSTSMWPICGCNMIREVARCAESTVKNMLQTWETKPLGEAVIAKHCLTLGCVNMKKNV